MMAEATRMPKQSSGGGSERFCDGDVQRTGESCRLACCDRGDGGWGLRVYSGRWSSVYCGMEHRRLRSMVMYS